MNIISELGEEEKKKFEESRKKEIEELGNETKNNYIIGEINILEEDINKDIRIINSFEEVKREEEEFGDEELEEDDGEDEEEKVEYYKYIKDREFTKYKNEKKIKKSCEIKINGKTIPFSYFHRFKKIGKYKIEFIFNAPLTNINHIFYKCSSLINIDLSNFNTQKVTNMSYIFYECSSLININLSNINTSNVTLMNSMFSGCSSLINLDLSSFHTFNVIDMSYMFSKCSSLIILDLSNFITSNVEKMTQMFFECSSLTNLDLSNFDIKWCVDTNNMFYNCSSLIKRNKKRKVVIDYFKFRIAKKKEFFQSTDSIEDITKYIQKETNIPISLQVLIYMGRQINYNKYYKILEDLNKDTYSFIFSLIIKKSNDLTKEINYKFDRDKKYITIYLYNNDKQNSYFTLLVNPYNNSSIKKKILENEKIENSEDFSVYIFPIEKNYIEEGDKLRYSIIKKPERNPGENVKLNIIYWGNRYEIYLKPNDKIIKIKSKIFPFFLSITPRNQILFYNSKQLEEEKTLKDYKIKNNDNIDLIQNLKGY